jgi:hypothetical protein
VSGTARIAGSRPGRRRSLRSRLRPSPGPDGRRWRWWLLAPALASFGLAAYVAFRVPVFFGNDERGHLNYTVAVIEGDLPRLMEHRPADPRFPIVARSYAAPAGDAEGTSAVANHPPLAYIVAAPFVRLAAYTGDDEAPAVAMRLVNGLGVAIAVALTGLFAAEALPGRDGRSAPFVGRGAAGLAAATPNLAGLAGYGHNDGVAFAVAAGALWLSARLLRRGPSRGRVVAALVLAPAALLTRASLGPAVLLLAGAVVVAVWRAGDTAAADDRPAAGVGRRLGRAGLAGLGVALTTALGAGWFLLRNRRLYGSATADQYLFEHLGRTPRGSVVHVLTGGLFWPTMVDGLYGSVHPRLVVAHPAAVELALLAVLLAGGVAATVARGRGGQAGSGLGLLGWGLVGGYCLALVVATASFVAKGGGPHPRYLFGLVPVASAVLARGLASLPGRRLALGGTIGMLAAVIASQLARYPGIIADPSHPIPFVDAPLPAGAQAAALALAAVGVAAFAVAVARFGAPPAETVSVLSLAPPGGVAMMRGDDPLVPGGGGGRGRVVPRPPGRLDRQAHVRERALRGRPRAGARHDLPGLPGDGPADP